MAKQTLTLVRGLPGSGKSTYAKILDAILVEADQFFIDKNDNYQYDPALIKNAHAWCQLETKRLLRAGFDVVVANTFVKNWEMSFYKSLADEMNVLFEVIEINGKYQNIHGVPDAVIARMSKQFEKLNPALMSSPAMEASQ
ncbi:TPA: ATP-binding protein [Vibrio vulnificus]|uniref:ATP-binding protein n=1 Tax=Vibrio parahaemolyticus TaxID=670 RepID=UPI0003FDC935|nr:ATP-binding protein [Vibrio parahaemolyticus]HDY7637850.1 ATP-binding protein [Vibrio vulnificus]ELA8085001.1 ATP-binding protein [Vibrio parahaemolyticus]ELA8201671.1 ATP-binding protein [Vibrio parahaemolyticus]ELA9578772.1 ATP-binding protein [Vibrio parahaemolyticus]KJR20005.1 ATPase AAA [Vibrio parahaemolyticus]